MSSQQLELDRKYRAKVRQEYYLRREDFASEREYDDYLEDFEALVDQLISDATRAAGVARLQQLRAQWAEQVRYNLGAYTLERKQRDEAIAQEEMARKQAAQERREADQRAAELVAQQRAALQKSIREGTTTVGLARAALSAAVETAHQQAAAATQQQQQQQQQHGPTGGYAAAPAPPPPQEQLVQPVDAAQAETRRKADLKREKEGMKSSINAKPEAYEKDAALLQKVRQAGGYDGHLHDGFGRVQRYRTEAFSSHGAFWNI